jgi:formate-dependent nitrite reductase membrane component NrfD
MSLGVWILFLFSVLSVLWAIILLPETVRSHLFKAPQWLSLFKKIDRQLIGLLGSPLAILVAVYTGVLLCSTAVPLWNWILPLLFLFSSLSTGFALGLYASLSKGLLRNSTNKPFKKIIVHRYRLLLIGQLFAVSAFLALTLLTQHREILLHLISGWIGLLWWFGAIGAGILFPLVVSFYKDKSRRLFLTATLVELAGAFLLRWSLLLAGQA